MKVELTDIEVKVLKQLVRLGREALKEHRPETTGDQAVLKRIEEKFKYKQTD